MTSYGVSSDLLVVVSAAQVREQLERRKVGLIVSVGYPCPVASSVPVVRVATRDFLRVNQGEMEAALPAIHAAWRENCLVLFHCQQGRDRSPTFADICYADYLGPGRETEALDYVNGHVQGMRREPFADIVRSGVPFLRHDDVAIYIAVEMERQLVLGPLDVYRILATRRLWKQHGDLQDVVYAFERGSMLLDIPGLADDKISPQALQIRTGIEPFCQAWGHSEENCRASGFQLRKDSRPKRELCLAVLSS